MERPNIGPPPCPFPNERKSQKLREEDAFMQEHGGWGPYWFSNFLEAIFDRRRFLRRK
ncbi:hypothetical protein [Lentilitoribacter sp. EG35]|uniref:hypothetical protein n=1 Tax=Lentilitoribacter sp. EG35 TaxID=3234192 RepID=UPI00345F3B0C